MRKRILRESDAGSEEYARYGRPAHQREVYGDQERQFEIRKIGDEPRHIYLKEDSGERYPDHRRNVELEDATLADRLAERFGELGHHFAAGLAVSGRGLAAFSRLR